MLKIIYCHASYPTELSFSRASSRLRRMLSHKKRRESFSLEGSATGILWSRVKKYTAPTILNMLPWRCLRAGWEAMVVRNTDIGGDGIVMADS